jgi:hypothetical protein
MYYALLFFIPILIVAAFVKLYFKWKYTWGEFGLQVGITFAVLSVLFLSAGAFQLSDNKLVNGVVATLDADKQSCPSGWRSSRDSHCTEYRTREVYSHQTCSGTGTSRSCTNHYDTEYNYTYDWEQRYFVTSSIDTGYEINREDRQGVIVPSRFSEIQLGDPVTVSVSYSNYIKGASDSLFAEEEPVENIPIAYPSVRDYYKSNRVILINTEADSNLFREWNQSLAVVNSAVRETGGNAIIVLTDSKFSDTPEALARSWDAHNINDVVTVIGRTGDVIDWVDSRSWSNNSLVTVEIENEIMNLGTLDSSQINDIIQTSILANFDEKSMEDFAYLADDIVPPKWAFILAGIILLIITPITTFLFHKHDIV